MNTTYIYGLVDPRDHKLFYVGKSNRPNARLSQHIAEASAGGKHAKSLRIREMTASGYQPELIILEAVEQELSVAAEERWIAAFRPSGDLCNVRDTCKFTRRSDHAWHETHAGWRSGLTGDDLRAVRTKHGWSQAELARRVGVSPAAVSRWEAGNRKIPDTVARLLVHDT
jgi:DNA-binding transcriptional regulator YiaG